MPRAKSLKTQVAEAEMALRAAVARGRRLRRPSGKIALEVLELAVDYCVKREKVVGLRRRDINRRFKNHAVASCPCCGRAVIGPENACPECGLPYGD